MLSRVADALYWLNRYVERADHFARFLENSLALGLDRGDPERSLWRPMLEASGVADRFHERHLICNARSCLDFLARCPENPSSIVRCIGSARDNARQVRDRLTTEMWEQLNELHWRLQDDAFWMQPILESLREIRRGCSLFYGCMDVSQSRDQAWEFAQLGRWLERADKTSRLLDAHWLLMAADPRLPSRPPLLDEQHWIGVLACLGADQMYRQHGGDGLDAESVSTFLLLDRRFPRSVRHCIEAANASLRGLLHDPAMERQLTHMDRLLACMSAGSDTRRRLFRLQADLPRQAWELRQLGSLHELEWLAGLLQARWRHLRFAELREDGVHACLQGLQADLDRLDDLIHERYLLTPEPQERTAPLTDSPAALALGTHPPLSPVS